MEILSFCEYPFNRVRITSEGNVAMCCFQRIKTNGETAYIGNLFKNSFDEIWFGDLAEEIRLHTIEGKLHKNCNVLGCPYLTAKTPYDRNNVVYNEYPYHLEIDLPNTHCNVGSAIPTVSNPACIMCERSASAGTFIPEQDKLSEVIQKIVNIVPNLKRLHIQGVAEPFFKDAIFKILKQIDFEKYKNKIMFSTTTNGTLLKKSVIERYLSEVPISTTVFSIDAATSETFKKIRIFDCFEQVLENLGTFASMLNAEKQQVKIHNNINILNVHEVVDMVRIAHKHNVRLLEFNPTSGFNQAILVNKENCGIFKKAQDDIMVESRRLNVDVSFLRPLDLGFTDQVDQIIL